MKQGRRYGLSVAQRTEIWRGWKAGESLHEIGRAFGKDHGSIQFLLSQHGGIAPAIRHRSQRTLTLAGHAEVGGTTAPANVVTVELCSSNWKTVLASTKTDEKGYFSLEKPATGKLFYIRLSAPGLDIYQLRVRIEKHAAPELTIHLSNAT